MNPQTPTFEADYCHPYVGGHIAEGQGLLLLKDPYLALLNLPRSIALSTILQVARCF